MAGKKRAVDGKAHKKPRKKAFKVPELSPNTLHIYTDGSCFPNPGPGGWGALLLWPHSDGEIREKELYGGAPQETNNTMEMTAIYEGLLARKGDVSTVIYSDSQYCVNVFTKWHFLWARKGWVTATGDPVRNQDIIQAVIPLITPNVAFRWVKGHAGIIYNERVDQLANQGRREYGQAKRTRKTQIET